jgi:hypothetical protein
MTRLTPFIFTLVFLSSCSTSQPHSDIPDATQRVMRQLRIGMKEAEVVALMRPVSLDLGRVYYGGSGAGRLYFQVSGTQQIWLKSDGARSNWTVVEIGAPEPKSKWTRYNGDSITVE